MGPVTQNQDYFALFGIPDRFVIDVQQLAARYRALQSKAHPDRFAAGSDSERRESLQQSAFINDAYQTLKTPLSRARYLFELRGGHLDQSGAMDPEFLMEQMELRERLDALSRSPDPEQLTQLQQEILGDIEHYQQNIDELLSAKTATNLEPAGDVIRRLQFLYKLLDETHALEDAWL